MKKNILMLILLLPMVAFSGTIETYEMRLKSKVSDTSNQGYYSESGAFFTFCSHSDYPEASINEPLIKHVEDTLDKGLDQNLLVLVEVINIWHTNCILKASIKY